jgi:SAM-dependent methyltransferase
MADCQMDDGGGLMARDWNKAYEENDTPWDKGYASPPLVDFLARQSILGRVLVPGCGSGHDVRVLAAQGAEVIGMDIAPGAIRKAATFPAAGREGYELGDFLNLSAKHVGAYDWVVEHTCLCALDPGQRTMYANAVQQALKPGGQFLAIFFREVPAYDGDGPPYPISAEEIGQLFGQDFEVLESFVPEQTYPGRPVGCEELSWMRKK